jgi:hypothetical protein
MPPARDQKGVMSRGSQIKQIPRRGSEQSRKVTKATIETHEALMLREDRKPVRCWSEHCAREVEMIPADQAAVCLGVTLRTLCRQVELGVFHYAETLEGSLLICLNSLNQQP